MTNFIGDRFGGGNDGFDNYWHDIYLSDYSSKVRLMQSFSSYQESNNNHSGSSNEDDKSSTKSSSSRFSERSTYSPLSVEPERKVNKTGNGLSMSDSGKKKEDSGRNREDDHSKDKYNRVEKDRDRKDKHDYRDRTSRDTR